MTRGRAAWILCAIDVAAFPVLAVIDPKPDPLAYVLFLIGVASYSGIGALLLSRVPDNPVGVLLSATGTLVVAITAMGVYASIGLGQTPPWPAAATARLLNNAMFIVPIIIAVVGVPLVFPDGRLPSARYRWVVVAAVAGLTAWIASALFAGPLEVIVLVTFPVAFLGGMSAIIRRYRRGDPVERAQVKWLAADVVVAATAVLSGLILNQTSDVSSALVIIGILALLVMPIAIGIAILRYRLYEIDRIVSRTISYAVVSGLLIATFGATIVLLQTVLASFIRGQTIAVAVSTLIVFALFQPVLRRVRRAVDRRFDRARYDGERTVAAFSERLRDEVDMERVTTDLAHTTKVALAPSTMAIWLRDVER
ncbi:MAG: hypothetical protein ABJC39_09050 [Chloroflexota bacterium]